MPGRPGATVVETHVSVVFFVGDRVFKLKKPVNLEFLDWTSRAARREACLREVELNRRLAPDVYLGVADVIGPDGRPLDHLVVMRRLPDDRRLSRRPEAGAVRDVARALAAFHARAERSDEISAAGARGNLVRNWEEGFAIVRHDGRDVVDAAEMEEVETLSRRYLAGREPLLRQRMLEGMVVDGHGDLQADDVFVLDDGPRLLDCLEFDDRLRHVDVLSDAAFLAMDLERLNHPDAARRFLAAYHEFSGEHHPDSLVHHYIAYRAHVRARVACIRHSQGDGDAAEAAATLHRLSLRHLRAGQVRLVLVGGGPGTGKTTLARALAERTGWAHLRSDDVREEVAAEPDRYSAAARDTVYGEMLDRAHRLLEMGVPVVLDATWAEERWRAWAAETAERTSSVLSAIRCRVPAALASARAEARRIQKADASEAGAAEAAMIGDAFSAWPAANEVDTSAEPGVALERTLAALEVEAPG